MTTQTQPFSAIFNFLRSPSFFLPEPLQHALDPIPFEERLQGVSATDDLGQIAQIIVFSDGLSLSTKEQLENEIKTQLQKAQLLVDAKSLFVAFERKEKLATATPSSRSAGKSSSPSEQKSIPNVKHIIAVASGKGGVGKSTVSVNLALALMHQGYKVGILDADIYGPSIPMMLGINEPPTLNDDHKMVPPTAHGLAVMSFGFFATEDMAVIWRGPMIMKALQQFFWDVDWGERDFLILDLPPGTGDAQLTIVQSIPLAGAVVVTTPQNIALIDAAKGIVMFEKTHVPVLGVIENMSSFICPSCSCATPIFGTGGAARICEKFSLPLLGQIPLVPELRVACDVGEPLVNIPGHGMRAHFSQLAENVVKQIVKKSR